MRDAPRWAMFASMTPLPQLQRGALPFDIRIVARVRLRIVLRAGHTRGICMWTPFRFGRGGHDGEQRIRLRRRRRWPGCTGALAPGRGIGDAGRGIIGGVGTGRGGAFFPWVGTGAVSGGMIVRGMDSPLRVVGRRGGGTGGVSPRRDAGRVEWVFVVGGAERGGEGAQVGAGAEQGERDGDEEEGDEGEREEGAGGGGGGRAVGGDGGGRAR